MTFPGRHNISPKKKISSSTGNGNSHVRSPLKGKGKDRAEDGGTSEAQKAGKKAQGSNERKMQDEEALARLRKRMAGPSSGKAGLAKDQDEINKIIYEASKGSRFFLKEKETSERIERQIESMLADKDDIMSRVLPDSVEWRNQEKKVDVMIRDLEATRDLSRVVVHADMDFFYGACELKRDPSLTGKCFGVGHGVLVTCSYEARAFGVRSGMAGHIAKALCPHIILVDNDMKHYIETSEKVMAVMHEYDPTMAQASLDEAYLDITEYCESNRVDADEAVARLREDVKQATGLTVSCGIAANCRLAKIASDKNKPNGQYLVPANATDIMHFMHDLPVRKVSGIGRVTERYLEALGIDTCGDIWEKRVVLALTLRHPESFLAIYLGLGKTHVAPTERGWRRSVGREHTFTPTSNLEELLSELRRCADKVESDLEEESYHAQKVTLTCKTSSYTRFTRDLTLGHRVWKADDLFRITKELLLAELKERKLTLRLIGVRAGTLIDLRKSQAAGSIENAFKRAKAAPSYSTAESHAEQERLIEDEERQLRLAIEASLQDRSPEDGPSVEERLVREIKTDRPVIRNMRDERHDLLVDDSNSMRSDLVKLEEHEEGGGNCPICGKWVHWPMQATESQAALALDEHLSEDCQTGANAEASGRDNGGTSRLAPIFDPRYAARKKKRRIDSYFIKPAGS
ncbi:Predicted DNA damage inducible protein [Ceraceosorus bombacis]|uniref:DNA polymerase kappa n=1 Tax=Ceraceosorus bombacis TaxID=401625 RepID=A0A0P1BKA1_9BASI|nr:Predicted DNA damage inducible protein [Ceraceosorus bombacis]